MVTITARMKRTYDDKGRGEVQRSYDHHAGLERYERPVGSDAEVTLDQEETEETVGNSLKGKAHKNCLLTNVRHFFGSLKTTSTSL